MEEVALETCRLPERISRILSSHQNKMAQFLFEIGRMSGLEELAAVRALPHRLLKLFRKVLQLYDQSTLTLLGELRRSGSIVQCRSGCHHCCSQMPFGLSTIELIAIYHGMTETGGVDRVFRHCLEAEESWAEVFGQLMCRSVVDSEVENIREDALKQYQRAGQPCPFLERSMCRVYPYRPFACRMHFSLSPPHWCDPGHFQNPHAIRFNLEPGEIVYKALERLNNRFQLHLSDVMVCSLLELTVNVMKFEKIKWVR